MTNLDKSSSSKVYVKFVETWKCSRIMKIIGSLNSSLGSLKRVDTPDGLDVELSNFIADIDDIKKPSDTGGKI